VEVLVVQRRLAVVAAQIAGSWCSCAPRRWRAARGYTLVEMVGVVIIVAILLKMVITNLMRGSACAARGTVDILRKSKTVASNPNVRGKLCLR
jgi:hypothetical protein